MVQGSIQHGVATVQAITCSSISTPILGTSICWGCIPKKWGKKFYQKTLVLGWREPPTSLHGSAINLALLRTLTFQFVWPHCASGTWNKGENIEQSQDQLLPSQHLSYPLNNSEKCNGFPIRKARRTWKGQECRHVRAPNQGQAVCEGCAGWSQNSWPTIPLGITHAFHFT